MVGSANCWSAGPTFVGYWNDADATAASLTEGRYHTGDLMRRGEGDDLWFVSRKKDIIIRGGTNISPLGIEQAILGAHPSVEEAAVVGVPDDVLGQRIFAFAKLAGNDQDADVSRIVDNLAMRLAAYKMPEAIMVLDSLPRNAVSKVDRQSCWRWRSRPIAMVAPRLRQRSRCRPRGEGCG
ncbi:AMP-binding enzyme [Bradyrhizobium sp.]|uniref:AMP-binding enzyme n=1 Tax=Bradyrhizobium sp. TaxID=376 RepID=UPI003C387710